MVCQRQKEITSTVSNKTQSILEMTSYTNPYKFPVKGTYAAKILAKLLSGLRITNAQMMKFLNCPHAAAVMSKIRLKYHWQPYLRQKTQPAISGIGTLTYENLYWFDSKDIMDLKNNNPRIQMFIDYHMNN